MHLQIAERVRASDQLSSSLRQLLTAEWPAFYLGNVAADYQTICDIPRSQTHFYRLPPEPGVAAHETMLAAYPQLTAVAVQSSAQAAFIAGYSAHLMLDLRWQHEIMNPLFVQSNLWDDHRERFVSHNILLTYLDQLAFADLPENAGAILAAAAPQGWLPFAVDSDLQRWQMMLVEQLLSGATGLQTVAIYAQRMGMSAEEFAHRLHDPDWMEREVFGKASLAVVQELLATAVTDSIALIEAYYDERPTANDERPTTNDQTTKRPND
jgi:hypothetical protein